MLLIDKPSGITSHDVVCHVRKKTKIQKVGHAGTLDPLATGLLIILIGRDETKRQNEFMKKDKTYRATIRIGQQYDTLDTDGKLLQEAQINTPKSELETQIAQALQQLEGTHEFEVPKYSAIKVNGQKLYNLARSGKDFTPPTKTMSIYSAKLINISPIQINNKSMFEAEVEFFVSSGTYIRTLANEIGKYLNLPACISKLRRTKIGGFDIKDAIPLKTYLTNTD